MNVTMENTLRVSFLRQIPMPMAVLAVLLMTPWLSSQQLGQTRPATNDVVVELFYRGDSPQSMQALEFLNGLADRRAGIKVKAYDVLNDPGQLKRLWQLSKQFGFEKAGSPTFYLCNSLKVGFRDAATSGAQVEALFNIKAYVRPGCKHCKAGKRFLNEMVQRWPALRVQYVDGFNDYNARMEMQRLTTQHRVQIPSFPCIHVAGRLVVGYQTDEITGARIEGYFKDRSVDIVAPETAPTQNGAGANAAADGYIFSQYTFLSPIAILSGSPVVIGTQAETPPAKPATDETLADEPLQQAENDILPLPQDAELPVNVSIPDDITFPDDMSFPDEIQLPSDNDEEMVIGEPGASDVDPDKVEVPFFGEISVSKLGMPTFTFLIGLVDGFNPCAMWVLVFLLSVLVNIKDRSKILIVAGTFVVVSGLAYFTFMAAWFNVFQFIGYLRPVQIGLGMVAIVVGIINVKDFFAFHKGVSLLIPDSAKPTIYRRVREVVSAKNMFAALCGAVILAIVVNVVELLCTAGLPALYTQILTMQNLSALANYGYLAL